MTLRQIDAIRIYQKKKCLIVDDMNEVRGSLKRMLTKLGVERADTAATSEQAVEMCDKVSYDLVLCDYNLGSGRDGQQVLEELRYRKRLRNSSIFLMITAETSRDMVLGALEYLPDDYLTKPITPALLQNRLNKIVIRHEDLMPIKLALDDEDYERAIIECENRLNAGGKYTSSYLRIKAELLFRLARFDEAQTLYEASLKQNNPVWAQLGLGKTYLAQKRFVDAEKQLKSVVSLDNRYVEAHDLLAEIYAAQADFKKSQECMQNAVDVSPKSVLRQRRLANVASQNDDREATLKARQGALRVGEHSCFYTPQDYFDVVSELLHEDPLSTKEERSKNAAAADMYIRRAEKKHPQENHISVQATAAKSRAASLMGKRSEASALLEKARALMGSDNSAPYAKLEVAQAMSATGDKQGAAQLIAEVARENPDSADLSDRADCLSSEPVSKKGRQIAADLTKKGVNLYKSKKYPEAIEVFSRAIDLYPNHPGLRLNIVQVTLASIKESGKTQELTDLCRVHIEKLGSLEPDSPQYSRYQLLKQQASAL